jgi:hypothetical protein
MEFVLAEELGRFEPAVRAWAQYDARAAARVGAVEEKRLHYVTGLFLEAGFDRTEADARARLFLDYMNGVQSSQIFGGQHRPPELLRLQHLILTS